MTIVQVLLPLPLDTTYTYRLPENTDVQVGQVVQVPFGKRILQGVVWELNPPPPPLSIILKEILQISPYCFSASTCQFLERAAQYTLTPLGQIFKMALGPGLFLERLEERSFLCEPPQSHLKFSQEQLTAIQAIIHSITSPSHCLLLEGLTGSGKTEVYFEAIAHVLRNNEQVLLLLPEIALTAQLLRRFESRFHFKPALWHAGVSAGKRRQIWHQVLTEEKGVIIGARSALFLPYPNLGLIVVDEEHDNSYKQEEGGARYHARDMAVLRAWISKIPIILVSATPSLESLWNVSRGRYQHVKLKSRFQATLPKINLMTVKTQTQQWISDPLRDKLKDTLNQGEQSLLFLNRRGYAPFVTCKKCGHVARCSDCAQGFVFHKHAQKLLCHFCGQRRSLKVPCLSCGTSHQIVVQGPGVERLQEEVLSFLPQARVQIMSSDHVTTPRKLESLIQDLENQKIDLVIGTQMVAKGHHFPRLTCIGVIDGDAGSQNIDFRSSEKILQLLTQVSGRAGRGEQPGHVFIQTRDPTQPVFQILQSGNHHSWVKEELKVREQHLWPPFGRLAALVLSSQSSQQVQQYAFALAREKPQDTEIQVLGPIPAPFFMLKNRYRWRFLVRAPLTKPLQPFIRSWIHRLAVPSQVRLYIDIDPYHFN